MSISVELLLMMLIVMVYVIIVLICRLIINKYSTIEEKFKRNYNRLSTVMAVINNTFHGNLKALREIKDVKQFLLVAGPKNNLTFSQLLRLQKGEIRRLGSGSRTRRKEAATYLGIIGGDVAREALERALGEEEDYSVKVYISNALTDICDDKSLSPLIETLLGAHRWYRDKIISSVIEFGDGFFPHFARFRHSLDVEIIELIISFAAVNPGQELREYLFDFVDNYYDKYAMLQHYYQGRDSQSGYQLNFLKTDMDVLLDKACLVLSDFYFNDFADKRYYNSSYPIIKRHAYTALSKKMSKESFLLLANRLGEDDQAKVLISALTRMINDNPRFLYIVEEMFLTDNNLHIRGRLAQILSNKIEYYILKLPTSKRGNSTAIIQQIIRDGEISEIIGFLNKNRDLEIENILVKIIKETVTLGTSAYLDISTYLDHRILAKCGIPQYQQEVQSRKKEKDKALIRTVAIFTFLSIAIFPCIYVLRRYGMLQSQEPYVNLTQYVIDFNYYLAFYSLTINSIYLGLLLLSYANLRRQSVLWNIKNISMLFRKGMLPSISIIAPAFNEEKNIIASVNSLLNLKYPDYELIVVNDGSKDDTLISLIEYFELIRVDHIYEGSLATAPVRGIYKNPSFPKLIVVDKSNGGKADSLNAGINIAQGTYFCGIDADSLLETEALLRLASVTLDESVETPALGGNIFPINGCQVERGMLEKIALPKNHLACFQTIEYMRAFMAGRLGWQSINCLLIISGAFGLFRRDRIISVGGYLTSKGVYQKDTVGEDMELVVRIGRLMREQKQKHVIGYAFNANCWTEVPEDLKSLRTQRFRWHRGLIDILYFHRRIFFNPVYGKTGFIAFPYFLIFEAIGPLVEIQGYLMVLCAALLGILDAKIALLLFVTTILFGIIVSLTSLLIAERDAEYFGPRELFRLVLYAVVENFGLRQLISFWRVFALFNLIFSHESWGQIKRKGI
jgi:cellulose synthase/poly-beta-1,6-N-acetylglucosamine synthase-like glycosyltransferase